MEIGFISGASGYYMYMYIFFLKALYNSKKDSRVIPWVIDCQDEYLHRETPVNEVDPCEAPVKPLSIFNSLSA